MDSGPHARRNHPRWLILVGFAIYLPPGSLASEFTGDFAILTITAGKSIATRSA